MSCPDFWLRFSKDSNPDWSEFIGWEVYDAMMIRSFYCEMFGWEFYNEMTRQEFYIEITGQKFYSEMFSQ